jgi:hypothetical protein
MLFHLSIDADEPRHVAEVLAEIMGGEALPFPSVIEGSWVALSGDDRGTLIEVYPRGTELMIGDGDADGYGAINPAAGRRSPVHFALATKLSFEDIFAIGARNGWTVKYRKRGGAFGVIELWAEDCRMIEVLTDEMQAEYLATITIENWRAMLAARDAAMRAAA